VPIRTLRSRLQSSLRDARRLLHQSQTLDSAARELSSLATESEVVAAAARLAATVVSTPGAIQWQGAYVRHAGRGEVVVESSSPAAGITDADSVLSTTTLLSLFTGVEDTAVGGTPTTTTTSERTPQAAWIPVAPDGQGHGFLGIASRTSITPEIYAQLAAIAQLVELSLSNLFAHKRIEDQAAAEERRRIARDLHDGLAHELTFIASKTRSRAREDSDAGELARSADRALDEARRAISVLSADHHQCIAESISQTAEDLSRRHDVAIRLDVADTVDVAGDLGEHLLRIIREAISNAASHGRPKTITVSLWRDQKTHLVVEDDGSGFDLNKPSRGFGLVSMRERAEHLGGELDIQSTPTRGTRVEVLIP
jgi:signal transduction histidine kinase